MAKRGKPFYLRANLTTSGTDYVSDNIDISAYVDATVGKVLVVDRGFCVFSTDGNGAIVPADVGSGAASKQFSAQACTENQTGLVEIDDNSIFMKIQLYAATVTGPQYAFAPMTEEMMNPADYVDGFVVPTNQIHVGVKTGSPWGAELDCGWVFEVHTETLTLAETQKLLVSLTA